MNFLDFLEKHAGHMAGIADALATIMGGLAIHPSEAAKVHEVIGALKEGASQLHGVIASAKSDVASGNVGGIAADVVGAVSTVGNEVAKTAEAFHETNANPPAATANIGDVVGAVTQVVGEVETLVKPSGN